MRIGPEADTNPIFERWTWPAEGTRVERAVISGTVGNLLVDSA